MLVSNWIRAATEGATVDGRVIASRQLEEIAANYSPELYEAKIWLEHMRGMFPDSVFKSLGSVIEVKAEPIKSGVLSGKMALYVKLAPAPELIAMVRAGQKTNLSIELDPAFKLNGVATSYLMGVGVTDSPASVGTETLKFNTKLKPENLFSDPIECDLDSCNNPTPDLFGELNAIKSLLQGLHQSYTKPVTVSAPETFASVEQFNQLTKTLQNIQERVNQFAETAKNIELFLAQDTTPVRPEQGSSAIYDYDHNKKTYKGY
jgi:hypothetical protein